MPILLKSKVKSVFDRRNALCLLITYFYLKASFVKLGSVVLKFLPQSCVYGSHEQTLKIRYLGCPA